MVGVYSSRSYSEFASEFQTAIKWLSNLGVRYRPTRLGEYEKAIKTLLDAFQRSDFEALQQKRSPILTALFEVHDLIEIHRHLAGRFDNELVDHVKATISGPANYIDENVQTSSNAARNTVFELVLMAKLARAAIPLDFRVKTDVAAHFHKKILLFECKRPQSGDAVEKNVKKAFRQLEGKYGVPQRLKHRGIIAIDVSKLINPKFMLYEQDDERSLNTGLSRMVDEFISMYEHLWQRRRNRKTIAVLVRLSLMGVNKARNEMLTYCQQLSITPLNHVGERNTQIVRLLTDAIHL